MMDYQALQRFLLLMSLYVAASQACYTQNTRHCQNFNMISGSKFHAFIPADKLDEYCRLLQEVITCAYRIGKLHRCSLNYKLAFDTQRGVINAVCSSRKEEYIRSSKCFTATGIQERISEECLKPLSNETRMSENPCGDKTRNWAEICVKNITSNTEQCNHEDVSFMDELIQIYLKPSKVVSEASDHCKSENVISLEMPASTAPSDTTATSKPRDEGKVSEAGANVSQDDRQEYTSRAVTTTTIARVTASLNVTENVSIPDNKSVPEGVATINETNKRPKSQASTGKWNIATRNCLDVLLEIYLVVALLFL